MAYYLYLLGCYSCLGLPSWKDNVDMAWTIHGSGRILYSCEYIYRLRQPQAKFAFGKLVTFLMGRGAIVDPQRISVLRETLL